VPRLVAAALSSLLLWSQSPPAETVGRSVRNRPIQLVRVGDPASPTRVLVVGCLHGDECAGMAIVDRLKRSRPRPRIQLLLVPTLNPDGVAAHRRQNARGVDLNRNFSAGWRPQGRPGSTYYSGGRPFSEPETRIAASLIRRLRPKITIWYHQHLRIVVRTGGDVAIERRYAELVGLPLRRLPNYSGTATRWQNHRFPGTTAFVVELAAGALSARAAVRHAHAVIALN
jgi:protein MpaA